MQQNQYKEEKMGREKNNEKSEIRKAAGFIQNIVSFLINQY